MKRFQGERKEDKERQRRVEENGERTKEKNSDEQK